MTDHEPRAQAEPRARAEPRAPEAPAHREPHPDDEHPHRERLPFAPERTAATAHLPDGPSSRAWRLVDRAVLVAVFVGLLVPGAMLAAGIKARPIENRPLARMPAVHADAILDGSWFADLDAYLVDNVWVRRYAVRLRGEAYVLSGGTGSPQVIRGRDGWLFARNAFEPTCRHTAAEIEAALDHAAAAIVGRGGTFRFVAIPDKPAIYPEQVRSGLFPPSCAEVQREQLRSAVAGLGEAGIDGWTVLESARSADPDKPLFYRGDTHWTPFGALQVVRALVTSIDPSVWDESEVVVQGTRPRSVDLAKLLGVRRVERTAKVDLRPGIAPVRTAIPVSVELQNAPAVFRTTVSTDRPTIEGRTLLLFDSYFGIDIDLVAPYFADATWVHVGDMQRHPELATELGPFDTVIVERVERFLYGDDFAAMLSQLTR